MNYQNKKTENVKTVLGSVKHHGQALCVLRNLNENSKNKKKQPNNRNDTVKKNQIFA